MNKCFTKGESWYGGIIFEGSDDLIGNIIYDQDFDGI